MDLGRYPEIREALRTERPVFIADVHAHPLFAETRAGWTEQRLQEFQVRSVLAIPVSLLGRVAGVLLPRTRRSPTPAP